MHLMQRFLKVGFLCALVASLSSGCLLVHPSHNRGRHPGSNRLQRRIILPHIHGISCGHIFRNGIWVDIRVGH